MEEARRYTHVDLVVVLQTFTLFEGKFDDELSLAASLTCIFHSQELNNKLLQEYGLPTWASYAIFAVVTILIGTVCGLFLVCIIDFIWPHKPMTRQTHLEKQRLMDPREGHGGEDIVDDTQPDDDDETSEEEKISGSDDEDDEEEAGRTPTPKSSPDVRKRRTRKAD